MLKVCITTYNERKGFNKNRDYVTYILFKKIFGTKKQTYIN
uniref:Uncharacterized protein n=1 Tax=Clostridium perfringens TaxID=1502 RepID=A0A0N7BKX3_CLOPF|nr:hypothetical protein [Clostridium perfringens]ALD82540.1 hypothetical protein JFP838_pB0006 [Clostridium perfringens]